MKAVIMAGGRGRRISEINSDIPKPMIKIGEKPVLEHEIECLRRQGFTDILITVSYLGNMIMDYFGDGSGLSAATGEPFGVSIEYYFEKEPLGNAGALFRIKDKLTEDFLLLNADSVFDIDINRMIAFHREKRAMATIFVHPNAHPYDSGLIIPGDDMRVEAWLNREDEKPEYYCNLVNAGIHILSKELLNGEPDEGKVDLDRQLLKPLAGTGKLYAYRSSEYVADMGTPERYEKVCRDYQNKIPYSRNLMNRQKAFFLDRDGTINRYAGFLRDIDAFELLYGAAEAIRAINDSGYLAIVVTNQPVIARGEVTVEELETIHKKMETLLGKQGAFLDAIYYCPHHPDRGFPGEVRALKIACECRKPKPGLLLRAAADHHIDLSESWMVGDGENDMKAGRNAGCHLALIGSADYGQEITGSSLEEVVRKVLNETVK